jgi:hypothetical protein
MPDGVENGRLNFAFQVHNPIGWSLRMIGGNAFTRF